MGEITVAAFGLVTLAGFGLIGFGFRTRIRAAVLMGIAVLLTVVGAWTIGLPGVLLGGVVFPFLRIGRSGGSMDRDG